MSGRLQLIEQKLIAIDSAKFQNLCDTYLSLREYGHNSFNRTGSQLGKQKTVKGTPDCFMRLSNSKLAYIEYTTQADALVAKIKGDIDKCFDETFTGVTRNYIHKVIICFNSRLDVVGETQIQSYVKSYNAELELIGIDTLAIEIISKYPVLSREFLDIPIETGQILPFDKFISEYNNKAHQLSTPLDNIFLHRVEELSETISYLQTEDLIILSGSPGVGKTKIGLEVVFKFLESNPDFTAYAITKKDVDIYEDLRIQLQTDKDYILLIDDANRQLPNFQQILGIFKEIGKGKLKIVVTVRNYALSDISLICQEYKSHTIIIPKFTDEEIIDILKSDSFKILNTQYQKRIVDIADGNARLAIMGARLANEKQEDFLRGDVFTLFDSYFKTFITDFNLFEDKTLLKTLAIISFFFTIDREKKKFMENLLELFGINYYEFNEAIEELHKRELIEVQYNHARVSEQVMATYFFYKVFIKDELLPFKALLFNYFKEWKKRFKDSIIPANNSFGYNNVLGKIDNTLDEYMRKIQSNEDDLLFFLDLFWFYKQDATISFFYNRIHLLPEPIIPIYLTDYNLNDFVYNKEQTLDFISRFYSYYTEQLQPAIELGFEYIRKKPEHLPEFIRRIREHLLFDRPDEQIGFRRQVIFINTLVLNVRKRNPHYVAAFFALARTFLQHTFHNTHGGRNNTITWYDYPLPFYKVTKGIRQEIWQTLFDCYDEYPNEVFEVIKDFKPTHRNLIPEIMDFDLSLLVPFIKEKFNPLDFRHTYFVHDIIYRCSRREDITNREYQSLKPMFTTEAYIDFCKFDWDKLRDKAEFDFDFKDNDEYRKLKTDEIKKHFIFSDKKDFRKLFDVIDNKLALKKTNDHLIGQSLDVVVEENFLHDNILGFFLLKELRRKYPNTQLLYRTMSAITQSSQEWCSNLWSELENWEEGSGQLWRLNFFHYLPDELINDFYCNKLLKCVININQYAFLQMESYSRFGIVDKHITRKIFQIASEKIDAGIQVDYSDEYFRNINLFESDYELMKKSYFQQYKFCHSQSFDYSGEGFQQIFELQNEFLLDYLKQFHTDWNSTYRDTSMELSFLWNSTKHFAIIEQACDLLIESKSYSDDSIDILFKDLKGEQINNASSFIKNLISKNRNNTDVLNVVFCSVRHCLDEKLEDLMLYYLSINPNIDDFKKINWISTSASMSGNQSFGEILAKRWEHILDIVNKSNDTLGMIPIKAYLRTEISNELKDAEWDRKKRFLLPDY